MHKTVCSKPADPQLAAFSVSGGEVGTAPITPTYREAVRNKGLSTGHKNANSDFHFLLFTRNGTGPFDGSSFSPSCSRTAVKRDGPACEDRGRRAAVARLFDVEVEAAIEVGFVD